MKIGKILVGSMASVVAVGSAFAFNAGVFNPANIYSKPTSGTTYSAINCQRTDLTQPNCLQIPHVTGIKYYERVGGVYNTLVTGTQTKTPTAF